MLIQISKINKFNLYWIINFDFSLAFLLFLLKVKITKCIALDKVALDFGCWIAIWYTENIVIKRLCRFNYWSGNTGTLLHYIWSAQWKSYISMLFLQIGFSFNDYNSIWTLGKRCLLFFLNILQLTLSLNAVIKIWYFLFTI